MNGTTDYGDARALVERLARERQADVLLYRGDISSATDAQAIAQRPRRPDRRNALVVVSTLGGSIDAAYRIARALQRRYEHLTLCIDEYCKAAGTLLALAADELIMSDFGELGPLDVPSSGSAEPGRMSSGQAPLHALNTLRDEAQALYEGNLRRQRTGSVPVTTRLAAERASELAVGLLAPIYAQIDPGQLGDVDRLTRTLKRYADAVARDNVRAGTIERLIYSYPSSDFVIDRDEAADLFQRVRAPSPDEALLLDHVEPILNDRANQGRFIFLDDGSGPSDRLREGGASASQGAPPSRADRTDSAPEGHDVDPGPDADDAPGGGSAGASTD